MVPNSLLSSLWPLLIHPPLIGHALNTWLPVFSIPDYLLPISSLIALAILCIIVYLLYALSDSSENLLRALYIEDKTFTLPTYGKQNIILFFTFLVGVGIIRALYVYLTGLYFLLLLVGFFLLPYLYRRYKFGTWPSWDQIITVRRIFTSWLCTALIVSLYRQADVGGWGKFSYLSYAFHHQTVAFLIIASFLLISAVGLWMNSTSQEIYKTHRSKAGPVTLANITPFWSRLLTRSYIYILTAFSIWGRSQLSQAFFLTLLFYCIATWTNSTYNKVPLPESFFFVVPFVLIWLFVIFSLLLLTKIHTFETKVIDIIGEDVYLEILEDESSINKIGSEEPSPEFPEPISLSETKPQSAAVKEVKKDSAVVSPTEPGKTERKFSTVAFKFGAQQTLRQTGRIGRGRVLYRYARLKQITTKIYWTSGGAIGGTIFANNYEPITRQVNEGLKTLIQGWTDWVRIAEDSAIRQHEITQSNETAKLRIKEESILKQYSIKEQAETDRLLITEKAKTERLHDKEKLETERRRSEQSSANIFHQIIAWFSEDRSASTSKPSAEIITAPAAPYPGAPHLTLPGDLERGSSWKGNESTEVRAAPKAEEVRINLNIDILPEQAEAKESRTAPGQDLPVTGVPANHSETRSLSSTSTNVAAQAGELQTLPTQTTSSQISYPVTAKSPQQRF